MSSNSSVHWFERPLTSTNVEMVCRGRRTVVLGYAGRPNILTSMYAGISLFLSKNHMAVENCVSDRGAQNHTHLMNQGAKTRNTGIRPSQPTFLGATTAQNTRSERDTGRDTVERALPAEPQTNTRRNMSQPNPHEEAVLALTSYDNTEDPFSETREQQLLRAIGWGLLAVCQAIQERGV